MADGAYPLRAWRAFRPRNRNAPARAQSANAIR